MSTPRNREIDTRRFPLVLALLVAVPSISRAEQEDPSATATGKLADPKVMASETDAEVVAVTYEMMERPGWVIVEVPGADGWQTDQAGGDGDSIWFTEEPRYVTFTETDHGLGAVQVQRVSRSYVEDGRRCRGHGFHLPPDARHVLPLYTLAWRSDRNQYGARLFELTERALDLETCLVEVMLREVDPADDEWISDDELPVFTPPDGRMVPVIAGPAFDARGIAVPDSDGRDRRAAIPIRPRRRPRSTSRSFWRRTTRAWCSCTASGWFPATSSTAGSCRPSSTRCGSATPPGAWCRPGPPGNSS